MQRSQTYICRTMCEFGGRTYVAGASYVFDRTDLEAARAVGHLSLFDLLRTDAGPPHRDRMMHPEGIRTATLGRRE